METCDHKFSPLKLLHPGLISVKEGPRFTLMIQYAIKSAHLIHQEDDPNPEIFG